MPFDPELEQAVEKMQKSDAPMSKSAQYEQLRKFSNRARLPTETVEKSFVRFITTDPLGKQLYARYSQTRGVSVPSVDVAKADKEPDGDDSGETEHMRTLREIATKIQQNNPELRLTKASAMSLAITTIPAAREAYLADKKARLRVA
jgi:hypothetical protein